MPIWSIPSSPNKASIKLQGRVASDTPFCFVWVNMSQKNKAILELLLCSTLWSIAGIFMKQLPWSGFVIAGLRSLLAGLVAFLYMRAAKLKFQLNRHSLFGAVSLCLTMTLFCLANAIVLQFTDPVFIVILSALFLGKRFSRADIAAVVLTFAGISLFFFDKIGAGTVFGNLVALAAGLSFGCYYLSLEGSPEDERMSAIVMAHLLTFLIGLPFLFTTKPVFTALSVLDILILGIVQLGIPYVLLARGSEYCPPLACALLGAVEPLLNPLWVFLFDGEAPGMFALLGGAVVIVTITVWCTYNGRREARRI